MPHKVTHWTEAVCHVLALVFVHAVCIMDRKVTDGQRSAEAFDPLCRWVYGYVPGSKVDAAVLVPEDDHTLQ